VLASIVVIDARPGHSPTIRHRGHRSFAVLVAAAGFVSSAAAPPPQPSLTLEDAIALAMTANPDLAAARLKIPIAREGIAVARQRPNPDLDLERTKETPRDALTLSFPVETGDKRARRIGAAEEGVNAEEAGVARTQVEIRTDVRRAYYALCAAGRRLEVTQGIAALTKRASDAARRRFEAGAAPRLDVLQAELGAAQADNEAEAAKAEMEAAREGLNVLIARPPGTPTAVSGDLGDGGVPDAASALQAALAGSADLAEIDARIREQSARVALAKAQRSPEIALRGAVTHDAPGEFDWGWRAGFGMTLPLFQTRRAEVRVADAVLAQLQAERGAARARIESGVTAAAALASARRAEYLRYRDEILPKTDEMERMADDAYRSGQTSLVAMIQALQAVRDLRAKAVESGLAYQAALADLERAIGAPLP
jgi:outer membrane protein, heavy metal efflux system